jgi:hypothetical protein
VTPRSLQLLRTLARWAVVSCALSALLVLAAGTTRISSLRPYLFAFSMMLLITMLAVDPQLARERANPDEEAIPSPFRFLAGVLFFTHPWHGSTLGWKNASSCRAFAVPVDRFSNIRLEQLTSDMGNDHESLFFASDSPSERKWAPAHRFRPIPLRTTPRLLRHVSLRTSKRLRDWVMGRTASCGGFRVGYSSTCAAGGRIHEGRAPWLRRVRNQNSGRLVSIVSAKGKPYVRIRTQTRAE